MIFDMHFYVYRHLAKTNGRVFYIGKGKEYRAWSIEGRNSDWREIATNEGYVVEIIKDGMGEADAFALERKLILEGGNRLTNRSVTRATPEPDYVDCCWVHNKTGLLVSATILEMMAYGGNEAGWRKLQLQVSSRYRGWTRIFGNPYAQYHKAGVAIPKTRAEVQRVITFQEEFMK